MQKPLTTYPPTYPLPIHTHTHTQTHTHTHTHAHTWCSHLANPYLLLSCVLAIISGHSGQVMTQEAGPVQQLLEVRWVDVAGSAQHIIHSPLQQGVHSQAPGPVIQVSGNTHHWNPWKPTSLYKSPFTQIEWICCSYGSKCKTAKTRQPCRSTFQSSMWSHTHSAFKLINQMAFQLFSKSVKDPVSNVKYWLGTLQTTLLISLDPLLLSMSVRNPNAISKPVTSSITIF